MKKYKLNIIIPEDIKLIHDLFKTQGFFIHIVGGAVRDYILNIEPKDWDLVTNAKPDEVIRILKGKKFVKTILETGKAFGVVNVITDKNEFEIATARKDVSYGEKDLETFLKFLKSKDENKCKLFLLKMKDWEETAKELLPDEFNEFIGFCGSGRRPDSVEFTDIETDIQRRDLSCNALYYDIDTKEVIDLVGGINDLKKGIIRTVGNPEDRFKEDKLRILRSIRFSGRFGSQLDSNIDKALSNDSSLKGISPERIRDEFLKMIKSTKSIQQVFLLIDKYKLWGEIFPGININKKFVEYKDPIIVISTLMLDNEPSNLSKILNKLKYSISENKAISFLITFSTFNDINNIYKMKKLFNASNVTDEQLREFNNINKILPNNIIDAFINFQLSVTGDQVEKELGIKPGPEMGKVIEKMEIDNFNKLLR